METDKQMAEILLKDILKNSHAQFARDMQEGTSTCLPSPPPAWGCVVKQRLLKPGYHKMLLL